MFECFRHEVHEFVFPSIPINTCNDKQYIINWKLNLNSKWDYSMTKNPIIPVFSLLLFFFLICSSFSTSAPVNYNVGVVLDFDAWDGKIWLSCINMALSDLYASHPDYTTRLLLHQRNSPPDVVLTAAAGFTFLSYSYRSIDSSFTWYIMHYYFSLMESIFWGRSSM